MGACKFFFAGEWRNQWGEFFGGLLGVLLLGVKELSTALPSTRDGV